MFYDCIIIGGGASGLMLAASLRVNNGLILEKTHHAGTKLLMSGGGRCNITHGGSIKDFISAYGDAGPKLRKCLYRHNNMELASWLESCGISLADEKGDLISSDEINNHGRIFPESMKSSDILNLLLTQAKHNGWQLRTEAEVYDITRGEDCAWSVYASPSEIYSSNIVVVASGGITFPETGSDGSVFNIISGLGIDIIDPRSALAPVYVEDYPYEELSGISISGVTVSVTPPGSTKPVRMTGDFLFTHRGFSGPVVLNISRYAAPGCRMSISYNRSIDNLPKKLRHVLESRSKGPSGDVKTSVLAKLLDSDEFTVTAVDENGMVTAGGISLDEIDLSTMMITLLSGPEDDNTKGRASEEGGPSVKYGYIYAIGESIDADGITGGYNLQMCWSTARTAADSIADNLSL
ncbi:MAG: aminoacetone oxidase family FAD-binding enzyme [Mogibacterium sp.]|nr:aminoacetone oxidase family FAD-binding enzyme [Mogibacterium sp.]